MESLSAVLHCHDVNAILLSACLTRDWPVIDEQRAEAERQVRMAMYRSALGQISNEERDRILDILRPCCQGVFSVEPPSAPRPDGLID